MVGFYVLGNTDKTENVGSAVLMPSTLRLKRHGDNTNGCPRDRCIGTSVALTLLAGTLSAQTLRCVVRGGALDGFVDLGFFRPQAHRDVAT